MRVAVRRLDLLAVPRTCGAYRKFAALPDDLVVQLLTLLPALHSLVLPRLECRECAAPPQ